MMYKFQHNTPLKQKGFTLVELAIALMVIGLLIGGVLKGQELIENARITRTIKDINDYETAILIFRTTYNAIPGDMRNPARRLANCGAPYCEQSGNNNKIIDISPTTGERLTFWLHLKAAGLVPNVNDQATTQHAASPVNVFGGQYTIRERGLALGDPDTLTKPYYSISNTADHADYISLGIIRRLDDKMDDGKAASGSVRLATATSVGCFTEDDLEYTEDNDALTCMALIYSASAD